MSDLAHERIGHVVVLADAEVEQPAFGMGGQGGALGALDLLELVDFAALAVAGAADAVGEERLKPGIGSSWQSLSGTDRISDGNSLSEEGAVSDAPALGSFYGVGNKVVNPSWVK